MAFPLVLRRLFSSCLDVDDGVGGTFGILFRCSFLPPPPSSFLFLAVAVAVAVLLLLLFVLLLLLLFLFLLYFVPPPTLSLSLSLSSSSSSNFFLHLLHALGVERDSRFPKTPPGRLWGRGPR